MDLVAAAIVGGNGQMSYLQNSGHSDRSAWFQKKSSWIIAGVFLCLLAAGIGVLTYQGANKISDIGGSMTFEGDPDTRIYIGDKLVGTGKVTVTWAELLGDEKSDPLVIQLASPVGKIAPELLSGSGAKILESRSRSNGHSPTHKYSEHSYLLRRADNSLDHVLTYLIEFTSGNEGSYLILVRARKGAAGSTTSFERHGGKSSIFSSPGFVRAFGKSPVKIEQAWPFTLYNPP